MKTKEKKKGIVTKIGDGCFTRAYSGAKLKKDDLGCETVGTIDELCAFLGMAKSLVKDKPGKEILDRIQNDLSIVCSQVSGWGSPKKTKTIILPTHVEYLENKIKILEKKTPVSGFINPGGNTVSSVIHVCRAVARRLERRAVSFFKKPDYKNKDILAYLNRLSDLLFLLACRYIRRDNSRGKREEPKG
jgi:cob(I)alamin adenosyltransferase